MLDLLRRWAEEKYRLPWNHDCIQSMTMFELLIGMWEDHYKENKIDSFRQADGEVLLETGDPLIDKWERELAQDLTPDLTEGMVGKYKDIFRKKKPEKVNKPKDVEEDLGFAEDYSKFFGPDRGE